VHRTGRGRATDAEDPMQRLTISIDDELAEAFEALMQARGYRNRSEAFRDLLRRELDDMRLARHHAGHCVASLSYVYNHHERRLAERLVAMQHDHHDLALSTMHVHLDHDDCLESVMLQGRVGAVRQFASAIIAETGVRHGSINLIPADVERPARAAHTHRHLKTTT
jgi:CopG family nickel-responsive transcriptional regulator